MDRTFEFVARLIIGWRVPDPTAPLEVDGNGDLITSGEPAPLLPLPATPELVGKLPNEILTAIMEEAGKATPRVTPGSGEATGTTS
jgi:hypothetical protein